MSTLAEARERWLELWKQGSTDEAQAYYDKIVFPLVKQDFLERHRSFVKEPVYGLILLVGSSPEPLILAITVLKPKRVYFIYTKEFEHKLNRIINDTYLKDDPLSHERDPAPIDSSDVVGIYKRIKAKHRAWLKDDPKRRVVIDISGGKKSMVGAGAMAGALLNVPVSYVDNTEYRSELRRPVPGSEYFTILPNPFVTLGDLAREKAIEHFNNHDYETASNMFVQIVDDLYGDEAASLRVSFQVLCDVADGYHKWDNFDFKGATASLKLAVKPIEQKLVPDIGLAKLKDQIAILETLAANQKREEELRNIKQNSGLRDYKQEVGETFYNLLSQGTVTQALILTLLASAERLADRGKYSDAVMRLYRTLELVAQHRLATYKINSSKPKLSEELIQRCMRISNDIGTPATPERFARLRNLALFDAYLVLMALEDKVWGGADTRGLRTFELETDVRNSLLTAHQNQRAGRADYEHFHDYVFTFIDRCIDDAGRQLERHRFLKLDKIQH